MRVDNKNQLPTTITRLVETGSTNKTGDIGSASSGNVDINFPEPFVNTSYSMSVLAVDGGWSYVTALGAVKYVFGWHDLTMVQHTGSYMSGKVSWIAIGTWQ